MGSPTLSLRTRGASLQPSRRSVQRRKPLRRSPLRRSSRTTLRDAPTRKPKKKAPSQTALRNKADGLFSRYIRERDRTCQAAGHAKRGGNDECSGVLQCAHLISRRPGYLATRHDPDNAVALCEGHHVFFTNHPLEWDDWVTDRIGSEAWALLRAKAKASKGSPDYQATIDDLSERLSS